MSHLIPMTTWLNKDPLLQSEVEIFGFLDLEDCVVLKWNGSDCAGMARI